MKLYLYKSGIRGFPYFNIFYFLHKFLKQFANYKYRQYFKRVFRLTITNKISFASKLYELWKTATQLGKKKKNVQKH